MKKRFISIILIVLFLFNIINCCNFVYATDIQSEDYELYLTYNWIGSRFYVVPVGSNECLNANDDISYGFYYLALIKRNPGGGYTVIEENINIDNLQIKSENEKFLKPYIEDGHVFVKGVSEGKAKIKLTYNYKGKEYTNEKEWIVRPNPTPYFLVGTRMAVLIDNSIIEMLNNEQKKVSVFFSTLTSSIPDFPEGYDENNYFICKWKSKDESIVKIKGNDNSESAILEAVSPGETEVNCIVNTADGQGEEIIKTVKVSVLKNKEEPKDEPKEDHKKDDDSKNTITTKEDNTIVKDKVLPKTGKEVFVVILMIIFSIFVIYISIKIKKYNYK